MSLNEDSDGPVQRIGPTAIQLHNNLKLWYLELSFPTLEKGWHRKWFYLSNPSKSLLAHSLDPLGPMMPLSRKSVPEGPALGVTDGLLD